MLPATVVPLAPPPLEELVWQLDPPCCCCALLLLLLDREWPLLIPEDVDPTVGGGAIRPLLLAAATAAIPP